MAVVVMGLLSGAIPHAQGQPGGTGWLGPVPLDPAQGSFPDVAMAPDGRAVAVWSSPPQSPRDVRASAFVPGVGWSPSVAVDGTTTATVLDPQVAVDASGNAIAVWSQFEGSMTVWANRYLAGWGWEGPVQLRGPVSFFAWLEIAMDADGNAVVVWVDSAPGGDFDVVAVRYAVGFGWSVPEALDTAPGVYSRDARVAMDAAGNALVVWIEDSRNVTSRRLPAASGAWSAPEPIHLAATWAEDVRIAMDAAGNAVAVWWTYVPNVFTTFLVASARASTGAWSAPAYVGDIGPVDFSYHRVAMAAGHATVVWLNMTSGARAVAAHYGPATGWGPETLLDEAIGTETDPQVGVEADGSALALWAQRDPPAQIRTRRYDAGTGTWGFLSAFPSLPGDPRQPSLAVGPTGDAIAVWNQVDAGVQRIHANRHVAADTTAPPLVLTSPADGLVTTAPTVTVAGTTEAGARVAVNDLLADVGPNGSFSVRVALAPGPNAIRVTATDAAGNAAVATRTVTFQDPVPGLRDELDRTRSELAAANAALAGQVTAGIVALALVLGALQVVLYLRLRRSMGRGPPPGTQAP